MPDQDSEGASTARLFPQLVKFGAVGAVGFVVNLLVLNGLMLLVFIPYKVQHGAIYATIAATLVAIAANWFGNRYWAFSSQRRTSTVRQGLEFFFVSLAGLGIPLLCVWVSQYVLGHTSLVSLNIANNVVGLALGTIFRFSLYRWWVFAPDRKRVTKAAGIEPAGLPVLPSSPDTGLIGGS
jgi:putative flippase GtrA